MISSSSTSARSGVFRNWLFRIFIFGGAIPGFCQTEPDLSTTTIRFRRDVDAVGNFLTARGFTDFNLASETDVKAGFASVASANSTAQSDSLRLNFGGIGFTTGTANSYAAGLSDVSLNGNIFIVGRGDLTGTQRPFPYLGIGRILPTGPGLSISPLNLTIDFPATTTNKVFTGFARTSTGPLAFGYYTNLVSGSLTNLPFVLNLPDPEADSNTGLPSGVTYTVQNVTLNVLAGDTATNVVAGTPDGSALVGDATHGSGASQTISPNIWNATGSGTYSVRNIGSYPGATRTYSFGISPDGVAVLGYYFGAQNATHAYRWTQAAGFTDLGYLPGQAAAQAYASTPGGSKVVGYGGNAFTWTPSGGLQSLPNLPGLPYSGAFCISPDGAFIGGASYDAAFNGTASLWTDAGKVYNLRLLLLGLGADMSGWVLNQLTAIVKNRDGSYNFSGNGTRNGTAQGFAFRFYASDGKIPVITAQPRPQAVAAGTSAVFSVTATGATAYQWLRNGVSIPGATSATLTLANAQSANAGNYTCLVSNAEGSVATTAVALTVVNAADVSRLSNLSVRTTLAANQILTVGFTMSGGSKNVLVRAAGPGLGALGVAGTMADPKLVLFNGSTQIDANDNWAGNAAVSAAITATGAFPFPSTTSLDAALVASVNGGRTVQVSGPAAGNLIVEAYDAGTGNSPRLTNLSALNRVGAGSDLLIAGFTIAGLTTKNVLIRAVGPSLVPLGVGGVLADPKLEIYNSSQTKIGENDTYAASLAPTFDSVGAFPLIAGSKDAATIVSLPPGGYTVQVSGADGGTGTAIIELYELP